MNNMARHFKKNNNRKIKIDMLSVAAVLIAVLLIGKFIYQDNNFKKTSINNIDVTGLNPQQATNKLNKTQLSYPKMYYVVPKTQVKVPEKEVERIFKSRNQSNNNQRVYEAINVHLSKKQVAYRNKFYKTFKKIIDSHNQDKKPAVNAKVVINNGKLEATASHKGTAWDKTTMLTEYRQQLTTSPVIAIKKVIKQPITTHDAVYLKEKTVLEKLLSQEQVLKVHNQKYSFNNDHYIKKAWFKNNKLHIQTLGLSDQIAKLNKSVQSLNEKVSFRKHNGQTIKVNNVTYGWKLNAGRLVDHLKADMLTQGSHILNAKNYIDGIGYNNSKTISKNYVEVDLKNLQEYAYKNGKVVCHNPIMSGTITGGNKTPQGVFYILYKQRDAVLKGLNNDGSSYASPVSYWEPVTEDGVGLHDSPWQPSMVYGNPAYRSQYHSHGCLNNPPSRMGKLYESTYQYEPVVIYY